MYCDESGANENARGSNFYSELTDGFTVVTFAIVNESIVRWGIPINVGWVVIVVIDVLPILAESTLSTKNEDQSQRPRSTNEVLHL